MCPLRICIYTHALVVASSIWQSLDACTWLINGWTETKQVKLVGVSLSCIRVLHRRCSVRAGVCMYKGHARVRGLCECRSVIWSNLEAINHGGGIAFAWICGRYPIARRWKNVNKAASLALFLPHHLNASSSRLCRCSRYIYVFDVDGGDRFQRLALLPSSDDSRVGRLEKERWKYAVQNKSRCINAWYTVRTRNRY